MPHTSYLQIAFMDDFFQGVALERSQEIREKVKDVIRLLKYWKKVRTVGAAVTIDEAIRECMRVSVPQLHSLPNGTVSYAYRKREIL